MSVAVDPNPKRTPTLDIPLTLAAAVAVAVAGLVALAPQNFIESQRFRM
jgi:hypothetical protein